MKKMINFQAFVFRSYLTFPKNVFKQIINIMCFIGYLLKLKVLFFYDDNSYWSWQIRAGKNPVSVLIIIRYPLSV